ncbi:MAG: phage tail protein [Oscillospiraceae bacterium]|nr:phage tail protein [Oscillospiraceae bacterium]
MGYNVYMTKAGFALQAKLFAEGGELEITRVEVGSGVLPEDADWRTLAGLVQSRAVATSTDPLRRDCTVSLEIEYRADLSETEEPFQINEFGVFAIGAEGEEALILYGDLSDCPDTAVPLKYGGCVRRYPVLMEIGPDAGAKLDYPAGAWVTWEDLSEAIATHDADPAAHPYLLGLYAGLDARLALVELMYNTDVSGNPYTVTFESLTGLVCTGVWNTALARLEF